MGSRDGIESVFLITKTKYVLVNYTTERAYPKAIGRSDNKIFRGYRLVCRMRRASLIGGRSSASSLLPRSDVAGLSDRSSPRPNLLTPSESSGHTPLIIYSDTKGMREAYADADVQEPSKTAVSIDSFSLNNPKVKAKMFVLKNLTL